MLAGRAADHHGPRVAHCDGAGPHRGLHGERLQNSLRTVFLDGRTHTDSDVVVRTFNGESIGRWEGDALVVETKNFIDDEHRWVDPGVPGSDELTIVERIRLVNNGNQLEIAYTMTDPKNWVGEWTARGAGTGLQMRTSKR